IWGFIEDLFNVGGILSYKRGEVNSAASSSRRNSDRTLEIRQNVGRKMDGIIYCNGTQKELGAVEIGKTDQGDTGTKALLDGRKLSKVLKDMLDVLSLKCRKEEVRKDIRTYGFLISGTRIEFLSCSIFEGRYYRITRERTLDFPARKENASRL
ncbi:hypothetical protein EDD21DRAFT_313503, partial [Dissophora ornata]